MIKNPIEYLKGKAIERGFHAVVANARSTSYELQKLDITDGTFVCVLEYNGSVTMPKEGQSFNGDLIHPIQFHLYKKFEQETIASIQETYGQKYENRLHECMDAATQFVFGLNCSNDFDISDVRFDFVINVTSAQLDGVRAQMTLRAWNQ
jgi:hypothetical protein